MVSNFPSEVEIVSSALPPPSTPRNNKISFTNNFDGDDIDSRIIFETPESPWKGEHFEERWNKVNDLLLFHTKEIYKPPSRSTSLESRITFESTDDSSLEEKMSIRTEGETVQKVDSVGSSEQLVGENNEETIKDTDNTLNSSLIANTADEIKRDHTAINKLEFNEPDNNWLDIGKTIVNTTTSDMEVSQSLSPTTSNRFLNKLGLRKDSISSIRQRRTGGSVVSASGIAAAFKTSRTPTMNNNSSTKVITSTTDDNILHASTPRASTSSSSSSSSSSFSATTRIPTTVVIAPGTAKTGPILGLRTTSSPVSTPNTTPPDARRSSTSSLSSIATFSTAYSTPKEVVLSSNSSMMDVSPSLLVPKTRSDIKPDISSDSSNPLTSLSPTISNSSAATAEPPKRRAVTEPTLNARSSILFSPQPLSELFEELHIEINRIPELQSQLDRLRHQYNQLNKELVQLNSVLNNGVELYKHDIDERNKMKERRSEVEQEMSIIDKRKYETGLLLTREVKKRRQSGASDFWVRSR